MVVTGNLRHLLQAVDLTQDSHREVGMQPHPLQLACGQSARLGPDLVRDPDATQIMDVAGRTRQVCRVGVETRGYRGVGGQSGHPS